MQTITINNMLPRIFADKTDLQSDVWKQRFTFEKGKNYLVMAESGIGKSSLCAYIYGTRNDYSGICEFDTTNIRALNESAWCELRRTALSYLPQELRLFSELTAMENVLLKNQMTQYKSKQQILDLFGALEISDKINSVVSKLSIGQQQRVAIIRALCQPCDFFLLDEPVSHLDARNNAIISRILQEEARHTGAGIIATSVGNDISLDFDKTLQL